jgi:hypothetical protein
MGEAMRLKCVKTFSEGRRKSYWARHGVQFPEVGGIYTFRRTVFEGRWLTVKEITNPKVRYRPTRQLDEAGFPREWFREVRETDISVFTRMLKHRPTPGQVKTVERIYTPRKRLLDDEVLTPRREPV